MVGHTWNLSTQDAEAGGSLQVGEQPGLQSELKSSLNFTARPCHKKRQNKTKKQTKTQQQNSPSVSLTSPQIVFHYLTHVAAAFTLHVN